MQSNNLPLVSVIITTRNSAQTITDCLGSIKAQTYPQEKIEIIVVDNNSNDGTAAIAKRFTAKVFIRGPERSAQRNLGVQKAKGEYILYLDSDMSLSGRVIEECVESCEGKDLAALYIPEEISGTGFWIKVRNFERSFYNATCIDAVRFIQRRLALEIGGFDEGLTGPEDWDFDRRIRNAGKTGIINAPLFHNERKFSLRRYLQKKSYYAKNLDRYINKWGKDDKIIKRQLGFWYRYLGVFTENGKWKKLLGQPHLTFCMYLLKFVVGAQYLIKECKDTQI